MNNNWDESKHLHPDERYLSMVINAIEPVWTAREYFDTATSPLNPGNKDFGFLFMGPYQFSSCDTQVNGPGR